LANTYTPNLQLAMPAVGDTGWALPINANAATLDGVACIGSLAVTTTEVPSATLNVRVASGSYCRQDGTVATYPGISTQAVVSANSSYLYLDLTNSGNLVLSTAGWPNTAHVRLAIVLAGSATISDITDQRVAYSTAGSVADGTNWMLGTVIGSQIGTAPNQKLGFFGKSPVVQPVMGAATSGSTYSTNEQVMLQTVYNAVRLLGLGS
jgi:hypothetical protein